MDTATDATTTMTVDVRPGDCDPAGIVCLGRYQRWIEAASARFFDTCGSAQPVRAGALGTRVLEQRARFVRSATDGDKLLIRTHIEEGRHGELLQKHVITRNDELIGECTETRMFCGADLRAA
jgi:4-hydroxybenzoyl-CoA thioesterase